ncbi:GNAT family N-acetyltransferase [Halorussus salinisoli]|uniref:GNAT family N-acetyltransferase n=1 Tax=Halorussus salinisoli TaxID=2558242 RepID=UPI002A90C74A|nr:GNAT family N-acetyltransferase [Halorussus salinisoli]
MTEVEIRRATDADAEALARAYRSAYEENRRLGFPAKAESATERDVSEWIRKSRVYVAEAGDEVVGGVRLEATDSERVKLSRLGVHENRKGEGVGSRLLDRAERAVRDWGYATIWLTTPEDHPYLPDLYRRRGYEKTGTHPLEYREYDEIVMEKRVREGR